jgi:hypothetical protein
MTLNFELKPNKYPVCSPHHCTTKSCAIHNGTRANFTLQSINGHRPRFNRPLILFFSFSLAASHHQMGQQPHPLERAYKRIGGRKDYNLKKNGFYFKKIKKMRYLYNFTIHFAYDLLLRWSKKTICISMKFKLSCWWIRTLHHFVDLLICRCSFQNSEQIVLRYVLNLGKFFLVLWWNWYLWT